MSVPAANMSAPELGKMETSFVPVCVAMLTVMRGAGSVTSCLRGNNCTGLHGLH